MNPELESLGKILDIFEGMTTQAKGRTLKFLLSKWEQEVQEIEKKEREKRNGTKA